VNRRTETAAGVIVSADAIGVRTEFGEVRVSAEMIRAYAQVTGDREAAAGACEVAPIAFALTLRRGHEPLLPLAVDTFGVHGGHDIALHQPLRAGTTYAIAAGVTDVFEKSGRSGPITVVARRCVISNGDAIAVTIDDQQIVRRRPPSSAASAPANQARVLASESAVELEPAPNAVEVDLGATLGPERRIAPGPHEISRWAGALRERESFFTDQSYSRRLGFRDLVVPGPMLSAFIGQMLRRQLPGWTARRLSMTFRQSLVANDAMSLSGVITDHVPGPAATCTCDLLIEDAHGETVASGTAELTAAPLAV
jgi:hydroxyacyl-ACP dehydratase HTD2-like protein with hotdog domain